MDQAVDQSSLLPEKLSFCEEHIPPMLSHVQACRLSWYSHQRIVLVNELFGGASRVPYEGDVIAIVFWYQNPECTCTAVRLVATSL